MDYYGVPTTLPTKLVLVLVADEYFRPLELARHVISLLRDVLSAAETFDKPGASFLWCSSKSI